MVTLLKIMDWRIQMLKIRHITILLLILFSSAASSAVQVSVGIGLPNVSIGINVPAYPEFAVVPGYPVYYAPYIDANYFFYDGLYWVYQGDNWYGSSWYDGPWWLVDPNEVPLFILRVPVRYYRMPPVYFIGWQFDAPPRWDDHWGRNWSQHRRGWDRWDRHVVPEPAPLPTYQRNYSGDRYPNQVERQKKLRQQNYNFQSRDPVIRQQNEHLQNYRQKNQDQRNPRSDVQQERYSQERQEINQSHGPRQRESERNESSQQTMPYEQYRLEGRGQQPRRNDDINIQRSAPINQQQRNFEYREQSQRQKQPAQQQRRNNQSNNPDRQSRHDQEKGNSRND